MTTTEQDHKHHHDHHGHHELDVYVNGRRVEVAGTELTFDQVVALSGLPTGPDIAFTITYRKGDEKKHEGSMVEDGEPVRVKEGMIFNVDSTNRS